MNWGKNWFNVFVRNKWDIGWPCSPRLMFWSLTIFVLLLFVGLKYFPYICQIN